jgi:thiopurine S-methyltransferase
MQPEFWLERWRKGEIGFHQPQGNPYLHRYWEQLSVPPGATVFVPLCGKSRDLVWLRDQGYAVLGVELAQAAVRDCFAEAALEPQVSAQGSFEVWEAGGLRILCGDFLALTVADLALVRAVFDRAALIALPPPMRGSYAAKMGELLAGGVETLLVTMEYEQAQMPGPPFAVLEDEVRTLYAPRFTIEQLVSNDVLGENARFLDRGVTQLRETVYRLRKL